VPIMDLRCYADLVAIALLLVLWVSWGIDPREHMATKPQFT